MVQSGLVGLGVVVVFAAALGGCGSGSGSSGGGSSAVAGGSSLGGSSSGGSNSDTNNNNPLAPDCSGTFSGALTGQVDVCVQVASAESVNGESIITAHSLLAGIPEGHQVQVMFSLPKEPPPPGTYDMTNLLDCAALVDDIAYAASLDKSDRSQSKGSFSLKITGGSGARLTGSLDAVAPPYLIGAANGPPVTIHLDFPPR